MLLRTAPEIEADWRYELKYRLTYAQYHQVKNAFYPFIEPDSYTLALPARKYLVRSLYFDTFDYQSYFEKDGGNFRRVKFRIRTYARQLDENSRIRVEFKVRQGARTEKHGSFISPSSYQTFMAHHHWEEEEDPVLIEFERWMHLKVLQPALLVEYEREGFQTRAKDTIRITFDHQVSSASSRSLFPPHAFFHPHHPHWVVLEIKHRQTPPDWLKTIVQSQGLKIVANSKYCQGIDVTQPGLVSRVLRS